ncbi:hypothetical protein [Clostridium magnum]|uniref:hypothetical protein n=1 Tax=Clostridium magnum TaxID=33954 RepID=UPI000923EEEA|nr:hypothetical protein [Clostridium magnum]SHJ12500.1 hypothetical protein SAMN02745944_05389 [Clostridium magnum DSM 2767]
MKGIDFILKNSELDFYTDEEKNRTAAIDIKNKIIDIPIKLNYYKIKFSYKTKRGHHRENYKYVPSIVLDDAEAKFSFTEWINEFNRKFPYRALLNVSILSCVYMGSTKLSLR